ncbi:MAG: hypothetical protein V4651_08705 [Bacteroidota bacterium]
MSRSRTTDNLFPEGSFVYAKEHPGVKLLIRRYLDDMYYCKIAATPENKELVYFERELFAVDSFV